MRIAGADRDIHPFRHEILIEIRDALFDSKQRMAIQKRRQARNAFARTEHDGEGALKADFKGGKLGFQPSPEVLDTMDRATAELIASGHRRQHCVCGGQSGLHPAPGSFRASPGARQAARRRGSLSCATSPEPNMMGFHLHPMRNSTKVALLSRQQDCPTRRFRSIPARENAIQLPSAPSIRTARCRPSLGAVPLQLSAGRMS